MPGKPTPSKLSDNGHPVYVKHTSSEKQHQLL